jgi:hypothetical protein
VRDARVSAGAGSQRFRSRFRNMGSRCDDHFDVEAEVCPGFVGVAGLAITLVEYGVRCEHGCAKREHDVVLDFRVSWEMVHCFIIGME